MSAVKSAREATWAQSTRRLRPSGVAHAVPAWVVDDGAEPAVPRCGRGWPKRWYPAEAYAPRCPKCMAALGGEVAG